MTGQVQQDTLYTISPIVTNPVRDDPTLAIPVVLYLDGVAVVDAVWQFGATDRNGNPIVPSIGYATGSTLPTRVRMTADLPRVVSIGIDLTRTSIMRVVG